MASEATTTTTTTTTPSDSHRHSFNTIPEIPEWQSPTATLVVAPGHNDLSKSKPEVQKSDAAPADSAPATVAQLSSSRKLILLMFFSIAQFIDASNVSMLFPAIPTMSEQLGLSNSQSVWLLSAYQLTFASFLLMSGRMSDIYNPKHLFNIGFGGVGIISLIAGFIRNKVALIIMRAFGGIFAALTIPSALSLIVHLFPDPVSQAKAIAAFGAFAAVGNVLGVVLGAVFTQLASWPWIYYFNALIAIPVAILCAFLIPSNPLGGKAQEAEGEKKAKGLDVFGVSLLTLALILFIFAMTSGSTVGWQSAEVLAPLFVAILLIVGFFVWEAYIPSGPDAAALPPRVWFYPNFAVLFGVSLFPYMWWTAAFFLLSSYWQQVYGWSALLTAVHFLPIGITAFIIIFFVVNPLGRILQIRTIMLSSGVLVLIATVLLAFGDREARYWGFDFVGIILGTIGNSLIFSSANIAMFKSTPPAEAGIVGAVFNSALQLGAAVGVSAMTSIQANVDVKQPNPARSFKGRFAAFWFVFAVMVVEMVAIAIFFKPAAVRQQADEESQRQSEKVEA